MQTALNQFAEQSGMRILFPFEDVQDQRSNAVKGRMTAPDALARLIAGTPLKIASIRGNVAVLVMDSRTRSADRSGSREYRPAKIEESRLAPIIVTGRRISKATEAIGTDHSAGTVGVTRKALLSAAPGISGLKMLESLPGFNVQTDGPLGLYEFGNSVQVRVFNLDEIGFAVDGIPLGRSDAFGGSPVFRYVDNENLAAVEASTGAGDVGLPSYSSLGPMVTYHSIEPDRQAGAFGAQSIGANDMRRTFVRLSSGQVGPARAYLSYTTLRSDLWRGAGTISREHWEGQVLAELGTRSWLRLKFVANDFFDYDSPFLTQAEYDSSEPDLGGKTGRERGFVGTVPLLPETVPGITYSNPDNAYYYGNAINARTDKLYGATLHLAGSDAASAELTLYQGDKHGFGVSPDTYGNSLVYYEQQAEAGLPVSAPRGLQWGYSGVEGRRRGLVLRVEASLGDHAFDAGLWNEQDNFHRNQYRLNLMDGAPDGEVLTDETVYLRRNYHSERNALQFWARDRWTPDQGPVTLELGFKGLGITYRLTGYRDFDDYAHADGTPGWGPSEGRARYFDAFQPEAGVVYTLSDKRTQLFGSYSEAMALPKAMDEIASTVFASSPAFAPAPLPERSSNFEVGARTNARRFFGTATLYHTRLTNFIADAGGLVPGTSGIVENYFRNVGSVEAYGAEISASVKPKALGNLAYLTFNVTYNNATFRDDLPDGTKVAGNHLPDSAKWILGGGVTIEPSSWALANISARYTSRRYADYLNTQSLGGQWVADAYVELGGEDAVGPLRNVRARLNIDNLLNTDTLSFILPTVEGEALFRPLSPRTVQFTVTGEF